MIFYKILSYNRLFRRRTVFQPFLQADLYLSNDAGENHVVKLKSSVERDDQ